MQTSDPAVDCSSPREDDNAPPPSVTSVCDVLDRDPDDVRIESSHKMAYDELHEILSWMPAKAAIKYSSSLCKWLCNIHSEPRFIQKQSIRSRGLDNSFFLQPMLTEKYGEFSKGVEFHLLPWETGSASGIPRESLDNLPKYGHILSSSNGLLLLGDKSCSPFGDNYEFKVCNPATRAWAPLPTPEDITHTLLVNEDFCPLIECGYDSPDVVKFLNDYTIALPVQLEPAGLLAHMPWVKKEKKGLAIYSEGRWEKECCDVSIEGRVVRYDTPVAVFSNATKGLIVHYLCESYRTPGAPGYLKPYIAAFDIREKRLSREIKLPKEACEYRIDHLELWIYKWKETSICLVRWHVGCGWIKVWVLDEYGCEGESWREVMYKMEWDLWGFDWEEESIRGVGVVSGKGLLIATHINRLGSSRIYVYGLEGEQQGKLKLLGEHNFGFGAFSFMPYANTLRPVGIVDQ